MIDQNNMDKLINMINNKLSDLKSMISLLQNAMDQAEVIETTDSNGHQVLRCGRCGAIVQYPDNYCSICGTRILRG